ncbi:polysaccharide biosynthesis tyrosine autokinase [Alteromonadaceae bacterium BrNp21-10]|nr:polysaccharide biosynthesis tyrosine autokinase [Alteromonadaceae bacterium BrNp21-10]
MSYQPTNQFQTNNSFDFTDLLTFLWGKKFRIVALALVMTVSAGYFVVQLPKVYVASSTLMLAQGSSGGFKPSMMSLAGGEDGKMDTYMEFIKSRQFAEIIVSELELHREKEFQSKNGAGQDQFDTALEKFLDKLSMSKVRSTDMLRLSFSSYSPKLATHIVNTIGPAFFAFHGSLQQQKMDDASSRLVSQLTDTESRLAEAEQALLEYQQQNNIIDVKTQIEMSQSEITALVQEKLLNEKLLSDAHTSLAQTRQYADNEQMLMQIPWIMQNSLTQDLRRKILNQEQQLNDIAKRYKFKHHKYIAAESALTSLRDELTSVIQQLTNGLQQSIQRFQARQSELTTQINSAKANLNVLGKQEVQLAKLDRELQATEKVYDAFTKQFREAEMLKNMGHNEEFAIVDFATVPKYPAKPNVTLIMVMIAMISGVFSAGFWLILHLINNKESRFRNMLHAMEVPVLAALPRVGKKHRQRSPLPLLSTKGETSYQYSEAIRSLRTSILIGQQQIKTVAISSVSQGVGKASVAINLAESCSNMENVLLADIDLSRPSIARGYELPEGHPGITDYFAKKAGFAECLYRKNADRLSVLPSGHVSSDPLAVISTDRFLNFLKKLTGHFDRIILEAPPIQSISDALILSRMVDAVILVIDIEKTDYTGLQASIQRLRETNAPLMGVVFNKMKQ